MSAINLARLYRRAAEEEISRRGDTMVDIEELDHLLNHPTPTPDADEDEDEDYDPSWGHDTSPEYVSLPNPGDRAWDRRNPWL